MQSPQGLRPVACWLLPAGAIAPGPQRGLLGPSLTPSRQVPTPLRS